MTALLHRSVQTNGIQKHVAELGQGPLVLLCHGFPESWYSWRHQLEALSAAGYRVVAPDMRGYGQTDRPSSVERYALLHHVADMVGLLDALEETRAVIAGHDWGAVVAWQAGRLRPDRFRAVVGLSVPYVPRGSQPPTKSMPRTDKAEFYMLYFQSAGVAEVELERDVRHTIRCLLYSASGDACSDADLAQRRAFGMVPHGAGLLTGTPVPATLPKWLCEADVDYYTGEFARTGFVGGLNWYRSMDLTWELMAPFSNLPVTVPALYIAGELDAVLAFRGMPQLVANLKNFVPYLRETVVLPGCGHWTQQERPHEVNEAMIAFLHGLPQGT